MKRAVEFYEKFFGKKVDVFDERFSIFEIENFSFGLFDPEKDNEDVVFGNNVVPNINVANAEGQYERLKEMGVKIVLEITNINDYKLFQFEDTEGNIVEIYQKGTRLE